MIAASETDPQQYQNGGAAPLFVFAFASAAQHVRGVFLIINYHLMRKSVMKQVAQVLIAAVCGLNVLTCCAEQANFYWFPDEGVGGLMTNAVGGLMVKGAFVQGIYNTNQVVHVPGTNDHFVPDYDIVRL